MKNKRLVLLLSTFVLTASMTIGCGSSGNKYAATTEEYAAESAYDGAVESKSVYQNDSAELNAEGPMAEGATEVVDTSRKLITTMNISSETEDLDSVLSEVQNKVKELGGYIESSDIYNGSSYYSGSKPSRNAYLTLRIPANNLDKFVDVVEGSTNITNKSTSVEDVTLNYVDIESKKNALTSEEKRLLEILESAETVEDIITVESRLSEVRYEIESIESQLRTYDNKINYSTVYLSIDEVSKFTETQEKGPVQRMREGFVNSIAEVIAAVVEGFVWFVIHLPQIILILVAIVIVILIIRAIDKAGKKKNYKNMLKMQQVQQMPPMPPQNIQKDNNGK
ncbi:MAG: DUF4349 domain-containing protein [Butyrivibrio sp.]|nr:DUF4349 domain-containing protein [Butyrivibrio sp.]